jgi:16S rRNA (cytidine1402-2'-O)-methyltransferase
MASGMNGHFTFHGYLPIEKTRKKASFKSLELSFEKNQSQIFIETPYRNNKLLEDLIQILNQTHLCIANRYHIANRYIKTKKIAAWKKETIDS